MIVDCEAKKFKGLVNPYTKEPMNVKMLVRQGGAPMFFCPDTYSTATRFPTVQAALDAWDRKDGIGGVKPRGSLKCAYTGEDLRVAEDCAGFYLEGGFDPHRLMTDDEFLYFANMRDGASSYPKPADAGRVELVERAAEVPASGESDDPDADMMAAAEQAVNSFKDAVGIVKKTVVNGFGHGKGRHK